MSKRTVVFGLKMLVLGVSVSALAGCSACFGGKSGAVAAEPRQETVVAAAQETDCIPLLGPRGPDGLTGPAGPQGPVGATGVAGAVLVGPRGAEGAVGPAGIQGATGATGPAGAVVAGGVGVIGRTGPAGAQGAMGATGVQGASADGFAGPTGAIGAAGPQGATGLTGAQGATLVGPTGPAGHIGQAGVQGATGDTGVAGSTTAGVAGSTGPTGAAGVVGATGSTGATGVVGIIPCWVSYREFWFDAAKSDIRANDTAKLAEIAAYMKANPSLRIGLDGYRDPNAGSLSDNRVYAVRDSLIQAGVPAEKIVIGAFGNAKNRQDRRVEVLIDTAH